MNDNERMGFFHEMFHPSLLRLGPGTDACTIRALNTVLSAAGKRDVDRPNGWPKMLDLGCGTGAQTLVLARHLAGSIVATDNQQPNLDALRQKVDAAGLGGKVTTLCQDMRTLEFDEGAFDLIWSEGALFCMGFREGLKRCRPWLVPGGFFVVTELCWLRPDVPAPCRKFFEGAYPVMGDTDTILGWMKESDYVVLDHFALPESAWRDEFYVPLGRRLQTLREQYANDADKMGMIQMVQAEIDNYDTYSAYYGYLCCVMQR